jgi:hypothetical protein
MDKYRIKSNGLSVSWGGARSAGIDALPGVAVEVDLRELLGVRSCCPSIDFEKVEQQGKTFIADETPLSAREGMQ